MAGRIGLRPLLAIVALCGYAAHVDSARILFGYAPQAISHFRSLLPFIKRMASDGHEVTVFHTHEKANEFKSPNITIIPIVYKPADDPDIVEMIWKSSMHGFIMPMATASMGKISEAYVEKYPNELRDVLNTEWDLVVGCSLFNLHMLAFSEILSRERNIPYITFHSTAILTSLSYQYGMELPLASVSSIIVPEPKSFDDVGKVSFLGTRLVYVWESMGELLATIVTEPSIFPPMMRKYGAPDFDLRTFIGRTGFLLGDMPEFMSYPIPQTTDYRTIGANCDVPKPVGDEFREFIEDPNSKGTIYIAFGTIIPWDIAPEDKKAAFFDAIDTLTDYRIVFSYRGKFPDRKIPSHIRLVKWAPQLDLLAHSKTILFITHGGLKSVKEGICAMTPMLVMPMFAEQSRNSKMIMRLGIGGALNKYDLTSETLLTGVRRVLSNADTFVTRSRKVRAMYVDRPVPDLDNGAFYVNRLIRIRQNRQLSTAELSSRLFFRRRAIDLDSITHLSLDIFLIMLIAALCLTRK